MKNKIIEDKVSKRGLNSLKSNRYFKNILIAICLFSTIELILYFGFDVIIARAANDYGSQHVNFIDYLRQSFWASGDLFPQWEMNYGLGQSFIIFFYYGLYNPYLLIMYVLPHMRPEYLLQIILLIMICINTLSMTKLLYLNQIDGRLNTFVAVLSSFSGVLFFHISTHPMFIYYLPIMTFSLVALHFLAESSKKSSYMFAVGMVFFTNFTFAPIISIIQFLYYISLLIEKKELNFKNIIEFIKAYIVGVGMGMVILIPTALFMLESNSRDSAFEINSMMFTAAEMVDNLSLYTYISGISIVGLVAIIGTLFFMRKVENYILLIPLLLMGLFKYLNYALNLFQYVHVKQYIMIIPIYWLLFAKVSKSLNRRIFALISLISTILVLLTSSFLKTSLDYGLFISSAILIFVIVSYPKSRIAYPAMILVAVYISITGCNFVTTEVVNSKNLIEISENYSPYRVANPKNILYSTNDFTPNVYTSLENDNYMKIQTTEYESSSVGPLRSTDTETFKNAYFQNIFGITNDNFIVNPIVYGLTDSQVYNIDEYSKLNADEKLYATNQVAFVDSSNNEGYESKFDITEVYNSNKEFSVPDELRKTYKIPVEYQNGIMTISLKVDLDKKTRDNQMISINGVRNQAQYRDTYGLNDNTTVTFIVNTYETNELDVHFKKPTGELSYKDLKVKYQDLGNFNKNKISVTNPESFKIDLNNSMEFDINLNEDGYLASTIPYSNGYTIMVDGKEVETKLINGLFLGAKLPKGNHHLKIKFEIPGFKVGLILTSLSIIIVITTACLERKKSKSKKN